MKRKKWILLATAAVTLLLCFFFRYQILKGIGSFLIVHDTLKPSVYAFVLSGGPWDRGTEAVHLCMRGYVDTLVCTGINIPHDFKALGLDMPECEITQQCILRQGIPASQVLLLRQGTSTQEESEVILDFCKRRSIKQIIVISTDFHTRRVAQVFKKKFRKEGIEVIVHAAFSTSYDAQRWWQSENGLIALNNEYLKQLYYLLKY